MHFVYKNSALYRLIVCHYRLCLRLSMYFPCSLSGCSITDFPVNYFGPGRYSTRYVALITVSCELALPVGLCAEEYIGASLSKRNNATVLIIESLGEFSKLSAKRLDACERW